MIIDGGKVIEIIQFNTHLSLPNIEPGLVSRRVVNWFSIVSLGALKTVISFKTTTKNNNIEWIGLKFNGLIHETMNL